MPDDPWFAFALSPITIDLSQWSPAQKEQLQHDLVEALGYVKALKLRSILVDAGVLA